MNLSPSGLAVILQDHHGVIDASAKGHIIETLRAAAIRIGELEEQLKEQRQEDVQVTGPGIVVSQVCLRCDVHHDMVDDRFWRLHHAKHLVEIEDHLGGPLYARQEDDVDQELHKTTRHPDYDAGQWRVGCADCVFWLGDLSLDAASAAIVAHESGRGEQVTELEEEQA